MATLTTAAKATVLNALTGLIDAGSGTATGVLEIWTTGLGTLLGTLSFSNPAFPTTATGTATASTITQDTAADATGTAAVWVAKNRSGTEVMRGTASGPGGGGELELNTTAIVAGGPIQVSSFTITQA